MIDVFCSGLSFCSATMKYDHMMQLLRDDNIVKPDDYIELEFPDGTKAAVRKRWISAICESDEEK